jgi:hypothetical protein
LSVIGIGLDSNKKSASQAFSRLSRIPIFILRLTALLMSESWCMCMLHNTLGLSMFLLS